MATEASAPKRVAELKKEQIEQLQGVFTGALNDAVAKCGVESVPALLRHMAKRMEHEASTLDHRPTVDARASHMRLVTSLGKKEESKIRNVKDDSNYNKDWIPDGVPEVAFSPTFFGNAAKAVTFENREGKIVSWGQTTDFAPFERILWLLFKELKEGKMATETYYGPTPDAKFSWDRVPNPEARLKDKELAIRVAEDISKSFWTTVLATVQVQGWRAPWMLMVLFLILVSYPACTELWLHALKGGPACDCEIGFIRTVLIGLGFECRWDGAFTAPRESPDAKKKLTRFVWYKDRPMGRNPFQPPPFEVNLTVHHDPDDIDVEGICNNLHPTSGNATAPYLKRIAVVSAPVKVHGAEERADEKLNVALGNALDMMQERVKEHGFGENLPRSQAEAAAFVAKRESDLLAQSAA